MSVLQDTKIEEKQLHPVQPVRDQLVGRDGSGERSEDVGEVKPAPRILIPGVMSASDLERGVTPVISLARDELLGAGTKFSQVPSAHGWPAEPVEVDLCGFKTYSEIDGEHYVCGKEKHGWKVSHGSWIKE